ncbi:Glutathione transport system permease protein GsiC [Achromobacter aegrifaciens]|uniref:ABC transporter permease n=1 Tax=Achromobacter aegrifaciens TaxID=1287736 RepID=UPI0014677B95|nr:Glutathione transport system permease protein GsiC [Achromobacter aegrifaciens]
MLRKLIERVLATLPVVLIVAFLIFLMLRLSPGDPAVIMAGDNASPQDVERIRMQLGLDQPLLLSFLTWLGNVLRGDLGMSLFANMPVTALIAQRLEPTLMLAGFATLFSVTLAVPLGVLAATRQGSWIDRGVMVFVVLGFSMPVFLIGYGLIKVFAIQLGWVPVQGYVSFWTDPLKALHHLWLPAITIGLVYAALVARMTRSSMMDVLRQDYMRTARAKGLRASTILGLHALKNAAPPIVTTVGAGVAMLLGGVVVTESVFAIPGLGRLTIDVVLRRDYPVIQGLLLLFSLIYFIVNMVVDMIYVAVDPRVRS